LVKKRGFARKSKYQEDGAYLLRLEKEGAFTA